MKKDDQKTGTGTHGTNPTFVHLIEFADNVQTYFRELILQKVEEKREQVFNSGLFPEQRSKATDLGGKGRPDVLRRILTQIPDTWYNPE